MLGKALLFVQSKVGLAALGAVIVGGTASTAAVVAVAHPTLPLVGQLGSSAGNSTTHASNAGGKGSSASAVHAHTIALLGTLQGAQSCPTDGSAPTAAQITQFSIKIATVEVTSDTSDSASTSTSTEPTDSNTSTSTGTSTPSSDANTSTATSTTSTGEAAATETATATADTNTSANTSTVATGSAASQMTGISAGQTVTVTVADGYTRVTGAHATSLTALCGATGHQIEVNATQQAGDSLKAWKVTVQGANASGSGKGDQGNKGAGSGSGNSDGTASQGGTSTQQVMLKGKIVSVAHDVSSFTMTVEGATTTLTVDVTSKTACHGVSSCANLKSGMSVQVVVAQDSTGAFQAISVVNAGVGH